MADGAVGNNPYNNPKLTADYVAKWVQGANSTYGLHIDYGTLPSPPPRLPCAAVVCVRVARPGGPRRVTSWCQPFPRDCVCVFEQAWCSVPGARVCSERACAHVPVPLPVCVRVCVRVCACVRLRLIPRRTCSGSVERA